MTPETSNWQALTERVEKLERQNRRLKQVSAVALILAAAVLLMGQASPNRTVEANEFILKDGNGMTRGKWSATGRFPTFYFLRPNGKIAVNMGMTAWTDGKKFWEGPHISLHGEDGNVLALLSVTQEGRSTLSLFDNEGFRTTIGNIELLTPSTGETHKTSAASVVMFDKDKNVLWKAP